MKRNENKYYVYSASQKDALIAELVRIFAEIGVRKVAEKLKEEAAGEQAMCDYKNRTLFNSTRK